jgi:hypothetical protein
MSKVMYTDKFFFMLKLQGATGYHFVYDHEYFIFL